MGSIDSKQTTSWLFFSKFCTFYFEYISISIIKSIESVRFLCLHARACVCSTCVLSIEFLGLVRNVSPFSREL